MQIIPLGNAVSFSHQLSVKTDSIENWEHHHHGCYLRYTSKNFRCLQIGDSSEWPLAFVLRTCAKSIAPLRR